MDKLVNQPGCDRRAHREGSHPEAHSDTVSRTLPHTYGIPPIAVVSVLCVGKETSSQFSTLPAPTFKWGQGGTNTSFERAGLGELSLVICKMVRN